MAKIRDKIDPPDHVWAVVSGDGTFSAAYAQKQIAESWVQTFNTHRHEPDLTGWHVEKWRIDKDDF